MRDRIFSRRTVLPIVILLWLSVGAGASGLAGSWAGTWERNGQEVRIIMHLVLAQEGFSGSFDSDALRAVGIPLQEIRYDAPRVTWTVAGDSTTTLFEGELHGDEIRGVFRENGSAGTFYFRRSAETPDPFSEEPFVFQSGSLRLSGTLLYPLECTKCAAVVFLHGSGPEGRWASRYLAGRFAAAGIAALIYDKRGVGESEGDWREADLADLVDDAVSAVTALKKHPRIDPARVGLHGHSQGGTLSPWVASRIPYVAFVIGSAAAGIPMDQVEVYSVENSIGIRSLPAEEAELARRFVRAVVATAYRGASRESLLQIAEEARGKSWAFEIPPPDHFYWTFSRKIGGFDPIPYWRQVRSPVLLLYGEKDERVPPRESASRIAEAIVQSGGNDVTIRLFPQADHTFRTQDSSGQRLSWPKTAPGYPQVLIDWVKRIATE